jgi:hypothetical protein
MKITGLAKELFEKWYLLLIRKERKDYDKFSDDQVLRKFYRLLPSQKWGVYQDWADSMGYELYTCREDSNNFLWSVERPDGKLFKDTEGMTPLRQEARNAAIEKLNQIINEV